MANLDSFFKWQEEEAGLYGLKGVVEQFAKALREIGVNIPDSSERGNARILKKGDMSLGVLMHEYTPPDHKGPPVWGILKSQVDLMRTECPSNWGIVLLRGEQTFEFGFWVHGKNFDHLAEGPHSMKDKNGQVIESYRVHQRNLEETSYAKRFRTVEEFRQYAHI